MLVMIKTSAAEAASNRLAAFMAIHPRGAQRWRQAR